MKITALMIVINGVDWVWWSLRSVYDVVDHIVVVEGAARDKWKEFDRFTIDGLSRDGTAEEIARFVMEDDPAGKVDYIQVGFQRSISSLRAIALEAVPNDTDYVLVVDADHLYDVTQLQRVRDMCQAHPNIRVVYAEQIMFFLSMHHVLEIDEVHKRPKGHRLASFFYRYSPELFYRRDVTFFDHQLCPSGWLHPAQEAAPEELVTTVGDVAVYPPQFHIWHGGWVGSVATIEAHLLKTTYSRVLRLQWLLEQGPEKAAEVAGSPWQPFMDMSAEEILDYWRSYHKLYTGIFDESVGERCVFYAWPSPLKELVMRHPFWDKTREDFGWGVV